MKSFEETTRGYPDQEPPEGGCFVTLIAYGAAIIFGAFVIYLISNLLT